MQDHPVDPETIAKLTESRSKESLLHGHEHLASVGERRKDALGLAVAVGVQGQIRASHRLGFRYVGASELSACNIDTGMEDGVLPFAGGIWAWGGILPVRHHHADLRPEVLLIVSELPANLRKKLPAAHFFEAYTQANSFSGDGFVPAPLLRHDSSVDLVD